jgi:hypothetical protein
MLSSFLGVLPIFTPPLCALTFIMCSKSIPIVVFSIDLMSTFEGEHTIFGFLNLFIFISIFFLSSILTSPSLSSHPYSHPFHSPSFSCATIHSCPSQLLFLPLLSYSLHLSSLSPLILPHLVTTPLLPPLHTPSTD